MATLPDDERHQGEWARYQRRFEEKLCLYQTIRLDISPAFEWDPHEHAWQTNFAACIQHVQTYGKLPHLNGADKVEFALARWLGRQLRQQQRGAQPAGRAAQLATLLTLQRLAVKTE
ncbi:helicase associated domain-containing protein [Cryobacterium glucosi]|nr:helicase associated domain-containing protein [Cryobacterium glucosi]